MVVVLGLALLASHLVGAAAPGHSPDRPPVAIVVDAEPPPPDPTTVGTVNEFLPERDLDDCISALPRPDCGSEARGGWRQALILLAIVVGLVFIGWRIVRSARRQRKDPHDA